MTPKDSVLFHPLAYERLMEEGHQEREQLTESILAYKSHGMNCLDEMARRIAQSARNPGGHGLLELDAPVQWMRMEFEAIAPDNVPTSEKMQLIYGTLKVIEGLVLERTTQPASGEEDEILLV